MSTFDLGATASTAWNTLKVYANTPAAFYAYAVFAVVGALSIFSLVLPWLWTFVAYRHQNLKYKYLAKWALVTGGSSGIGKSLCHRLAQQGLNVVVVAVPDKTLDAAVAELRSTYKNVEFRQCGVNLSASDSDEYISVIAKATEDIDVQVVFNNAGYMVTGFFEQWPASKWLANVHCNATAAVAITHLFLKRIQAKRLRGCFVFTSSPANIIPSPFSTMYGATKAFVTHFATSLACEVAPEGIDVSVVHPSPVATAFYTGAHALPTLQLFKGTATGPDRVADVMIRGVGRSVIIDQGYYPFLFRLMLRVIELTSLADLLVVLAPTTADYKELKKGQTTTVAAADKPAALKDDADASSSRSKARQRRSPSAKPRKV